MSGNAHHPVRIESLRPFNEKEWNELVRLSPNGHLMALPGFFKYHENRFEDASLFIRRGNKPLAVLPGNRDGDDFWSHQGVSFGGLIFHPRTRFEHVEAAIDALLKHLRNEGFKRFYYRPAPHPYHKLPREEDTYFLEKAGAVRVRANLHSMTICGSPDTVESKKLSVNIRKSEAAGVRLREGTDSDFSAVWALVVQLLRNHGNEPVHSLDEVMLLRSRFPEEVLLKVAEDRSAQLLAGHIYLKFGRTITSLYLGESPCGRELMAGIRLKTHLLHDPAFAGFWMDQGQWADTVSREPNTSLLTFKESMGGRLIQRHTWLLEL